MNCTDHPDEDWSPPILELGPALTRFLCLVLAREVRNWTSTPDAGTVREEVLAMLAFLADHLAPDEQEALPPIASEPPMRRVG